MRLTQILTILTMSLICTSLVAAPNTSPDSIDNKTQKLSEVNIKKDLDQQYQPIINEYKQYLETVSPAIMDEIKNFRLENVKLNNQKRDLWKKLSTQAQETIKKQREFKKKLPIHINKSLNENSSNIDNKDITK